MNEKLKLANEMVRSLEQEAEEQNVSLVGLNRKNFNTFLDDAFNDGGEVRCIKFTDIPIDYALRFGEIESPRFDDARWEVYYLAFDILEKKYNDNEQKELASMLKSLVYALSDDINDYPDSSYYTLIMDRVNRAKMLLAEKGL